MENADEWLVQYCLSLLDRLRGDADAFTRALTAGITDRQARIIWTEVVRARKILADALVFLPAEVAKR